MSRDRRRRTDKTFRFAWVAPRPRRTTRFSPGQLQRPGEWSRLGRPLGLTALILAFVVTIEHQWVYTVLFGGLGVGGLVLSIVARHDPDYMTTFPYEYVGDLEERPAEATLAPPQRLGFSSVLASAVFSTWVFSGFFDPAVALVPAALCLIWGYEVTQPPERWRITAALSAGVAVGLPIAGLGILMTDLVEALTAAIGAAVTIASLILVGLTLHQVGRRTPDRLL